ncbi:hypothetical protein KC19_4G035400 [Ceratodon purpureus]|uniref:Uncharacterized protein n=1 Tax=Ceratodon purpureus TaxID=3225 RepID=A0A8T0I4S8_CERPU|nr:hypothetical protein KC19_4G035400 [Ceratodon purpureus]
MQENHQFKQHMDENHQFKQLMQESHQFKQHIPSMTNFNCINQQSPSQHLFHTPSQLYVSGSNVLERPQPSLLPMLHQQWPM